MRVRTFLSRLHRDKDGATAIEYGLIVALVALTILGAISQLGNEVLEDFNNVSSQLQDAENKAIP